MSPDELTSDFRRFALIYHDVRKAIGNPVALALYVILVEYADGKTRQAFPSRSELAGQLGFKKAASVDKYLDILQEVGVVTVMPRYKNKDGVQSIEQTEEFSIQTSNLYIVHDRPKVSANRDGGSPSKRTGGGPQMGTGVVPQNGHELYPHELDPHRTITPYSPPTGDRRRRNTYPEAFEEWWRTYPRRKNASKKAAHTQWAKAIKNIDPDTLLSLTATYAANPGVSDERYIPHPQKWLKDRRWESIDETNTHVEAERVADGTRPEDWLAGYIPPANEIEAEVIPWQIEA